MSSFVDDASRLDWVIDHSDTLYLSRDESGRDQLITDGPGLAGSRRSRRPCPLHRALRSQGRQEKLRAGRQSAQLLHV